MLRRTRMKVVMKRLTRTVTVLGLTVPYNTDSFQLFEMIEKEMTIFPMIP